MNGEISPLSGWFNYKLRRKRLSYLAANIALAIFMAAVIWVLSFFEPSQRAGSLVHLAFFIPNVIVQYMLTAQRLHDMGVSGWVASFWLIPVVIPSWETAILGLLFLFFLLIKPSNTDANKFGNYESL